MDSTREFPHSQDSKSLGIIGLASPGDRLAAYILDVVILLPLVQLLQAPGKKWIYEAMLFNEFEQISGYRFFNLWIFIFLFITYYTVMNYWKSQTLGKMFFGLKVISYHGHLSFSQSFLRSIFMFGEFLCFGIPFLAVFTHNMRRTFHDRLADTLVISLKNPTGFPEKVEKYRGLWFTRFASFFAILVLSIFTLIESPELPSTESLFSSHQCDEQMLDLSDDVEAMVELYMVDQISQRCLFEGAREVLWQHPSSSVAKLALAFAVQDQPKRSNQYFLSVCDQQQDDAVCLFSQWLTQVANNPEVDFSQKADQIQADLVLPDFAQVVVAAHKARHRHFAATLSQLQNLSSQSHLEPIIASLSFNALLGMKKWNEALWVYKTNSEVDESDLAYFMLENIREPIISISQQKMFLEKIYTGLSQVNGTRMPASQSEIPEEIIQIHQILGKQQ